MKKVIAALLIVIAISFLTHSSVLNNGFVEEWDDFKYVLAPEAQGGLTPQNIKRIFSSEMVKKHYYFHPLTKLSFALEHQLFQLNPKGYHFDNLMLHLLNTAFVFWFVNLLNARLLPAFLTSLLFGIHPLAVETVAWVSTRKELLFTCFYLSALIAYIYHCIRSRGRARYILLSFFFFACSLLSKPSAATLPLVLLILDFHFNRDFKRPVLTEKLPFFALSLFTAISYFLASRSWESTIYTSGYFSSLEKVAICLSTSAMYFYKLIAPLELSFAYLPPQKVAGVLPLKYFFMAGFPFLALIFLWKWARNRKVALTGGLFFFATIFLSGSGKTFMGDHYVYLPSLGFFLLLAAFLSEILNHRLVGSRAKGVVVLFLAIYLGFLSTTSHARGKVWKDSVTLYNDALQKYPTQPVALLNRSMLYVKNGKFEEAIKDVSSAIDGGYVELPGVEASIVSTRAMFYALSGRPREAVKDLTRVIEIGDPAIASKAYNERGLIADSRGDIESALVDFNAAISLDPRNESARSNKNRVMMLVQTALRDSSGPKGESFYHPQSASILPQSDGECDSSAGENCGEDKAFREALDKQYWSQEILAQEYELIFIKLWDDMRLATQKWEHLIDFPFKSITIPLGRTQRLLELDVISAEYAFAPKTYSKDQFVGNIQRLAQEGYRIEQLEFHHDEFRYPSAQKASSVISFVFHVINDQTGKKIIYKGQIEVAWDTEKDEAGHFMPKTINVIKLTALEREVRDSSFVKLFTVQPDNEIRGNSPVILYDLDRDGFSEMILPALNMIVRNKGDGSFTEETLFDVPLTNVSSAFVGEFTGDDEADLIVTLIFDKPLLFKGKKGAFDRSPSTIKMIEEELKNSTGSVNAITAGDIDGDGDLDLFFGQYKTPFITGRSLPYPYYDANDGEPAYLLQNDGHGNFTDITVEAGLGKKRFRRTYSASFVDLDQDRDLDLLVVSDFSGVDVYRNNGEGIFEDITDKAIDHRSSFGMAHTFADFNLDGHMDIYVIGMGSTTARRLNKMGVSLDEFKKLQEMMLPMAYGNRLYYGTDEPGIFKSAPNNDQVARTGWGWGTTTFDVDNDGDPEIYVANGNHSSTTALDYCTFYWRNDIFMDKRPAKHDDLFDLFGRGGSWNGFEHNVLFLNNNGESYANIAYLMDIAFEFDTRSVLSDDINMDGRTDLFVKDSKGNVYGLLNGVKTDNHWVGVILQEKDHTSPLGALVTVTTAHGKKQWQVVSGDSFLSQHPYKKVFGLNKDTKIDFIEVQWLDGRTQRLENPQADRYHRLHPSPKSK